MEHGSSGPATIEPEVTAGRLNTQQLLMLEDDTKVIEEREKEIQNVVQSIVELNTIFKDLAVMVSEQVGNRLPLEEWGLYAGFNYVQSFRLWLP